MRFHRCAPVARTASAAGLGAGVDHGRAAGGLFALAARPLPGPRPLPRREGWGGGHRVRGP